MKRVRRDYSLSAAEQHEAALQSEMLRSVGRCGRVALGLHYRDGTEAAIPLSDKLAGIVADVLRAMAKPGGAMLLTEDQEVSPEAAADILGVSRALLRRRMDAGEIIFHVVGSHRRLLVSNVLGLARASARVRGEAGTRGRKTGALARAKARGLRRRQSLAVGGEGTERIPQT